MWLSLSLSFLFDKTKIERGKLIKKKSCYLSSLETVKKKNLYDKYLGRKLTHQLQKNKTFRIGSFNFNAAKIKINSVFPVFHSLSTCIVYLAFAEKMKSTARREEWRKTVSRKLGEKVWRKREREGKISIKNERPSIFSRQRIKSFSRIWPSLQFEFTRYT